MWQKLMLLQETRCLLTQSAVPTIWVSLTFSCKKQKIRLRRLKQLGIYLPQKKEKNPKVEDHGPWSSRLRQSGLMSPGIQFSSAQSLSRVQLFETPWTAAGQASLSISNSQSLLKLMSVEWYHPTISFSVVPFSSHLQSFPRVVWFIETESRYWVPGGTGRGKCHRKITDLEIIYLPLVCVQDLPSNHSDPVHQADLLQSFKHEGAWEFPRVLVNTDFLALPLGFLIQ